jgi:O-antigen/teichoic acid export membrane protein
MRLGTLWHRLRTSRSFHADATFTGAANLVLAAMGFCTGIISARMLGPHGRGELAAIQTTPSAIGAFAMIGMPEALVYFSARRPAQAGSYLGTAAVLALLASIPLMAAAYLAMPLLVHAQGPRVIGEARWYLLIAPIYATSGMLYHPLRGTRDFRTWNGLRLLVPMSALCVLGAAWLLGRMTPAFIAFGNLTSCAILFIPCAVVVSHRLRGPYFPDADQMVPMLRFGIPCVMTTLPYLLNLRLDQMLMAALLPARELGLYVVAVAWSNAVAPILNSVGALMLPTVAAAGDRSLAAEHMGRGVRMTTMLAAAVCLVIAAAAPFAIPLLFGAGYQPSLGPALILIPAAGVLGVNLSLQESIRGLGWPSVALRAELLGLVVTAVCLAAMLRPWGIAGAAVASLLGYSTVTIALLVGATRIVPMPILSLIMPRPAEMKRGVIRLAAAARTLVESAA